MSTPITREELLPLFGYTGSVDISEATIPPFSGGNAGNIIRTEQDWFVKFDWTTTGLLNYIMAGNWHLQIILDQIGGSGFTLPGGTVVEPIVSAPNHYIKQIDFAANLVPAGLYRAAVVITMKGPSPANHPGPITGFADLGLVEFYDAG